MSENNESKRGPDRSVTDEEILLMFETITGPAIFASELSDELPLTRQRITKILDQLENDGFVDSKHESGRRLWWLTSKGEKFVKSV